MAYHIIEVSREVFLRNARAIQKGSENVRCSHSKNIEESDSEERILQSVQNEEMT